MSKSSSRRPLLIARLIASIKIRALSSSKRSSFQVLDLTEIRSSICHAKKKKKNWKEWRARSCSSKKKRQMQRKRHLGGGGHLAGHLTQAIYLRIRLWNNAWPRRLHNKRINLRQRQYNNGGSGGEGIAAPPLANNIRATSGDTRDRRV